MANQTIPSNWDEAAYLKANPDVARVLSDAFPEDWKTGFAHWATFGLREGRKPTWKTDYGSVFLYALLGAAAYYVILRYNFGPGFLRP